MKTRSLIMLVKPNAERMHQEHPQDAIAQMPQIACPNALELTAIGQLPKNGVNPIANLSQHRTLVSLCLGRVRIAKRSLQGNPFFAQTGRDVRHPIGTITQHESLRSFQHDRSPFSVGFIGRRQKGMGDDANIFGTGRDAGSTSGLD
jgi:hypothetical protein